MSITQSGYRWAQVAVLSIACVGCGDSAENSPDPIELVNNQAGRAGLEVNDYLKLPTDALTSDKLAWQDALDAARNTLLADQAAAQDYEPNTPVGWYNADQNVFIYVWRRRDDRRLSTDLPASGYLIVLGATSGELLQARAYRDL